MIDERMEEQAALYAAGAMTDAERRDFEAAIGNNSELRELVKQLAAATTAYSGVSPKVIPPAHLRAKILAQVAPQKTISLPESKPGFAVSWWATIAACLAVLSVVLFVRQFQMANEIKLRDGQIANLDRLAMSLSNATNDLRREVVALQETNRLATLRIAMLNSVVTDSPKTVAVSLWDDQKQSGVFVAENLKQLPADQDYELWVIDENKTPVAAGVFHVDDSGRVKMDFKPTRLIQTAGMFAVTQEAKGGVATPTMKQMILAGK